MPAIDGTRSRVVGGQRELHVVMVASEHLVKVCSAAADVLLGLESIGDAQRGRGTGHQLHQALRASVRCGADLAVALRFDHTPEQIGVDVVCGACFGEQRMKCVEG